MLIYQTAIADIKVQVTVSYEIGATYTLYVYKEGEIVECKFGHDRNRMMAIADDKLVEYSEAEEVNLLEAP